jgi:hypothetical protein
MRTGRFDEPGGPEVPATCYVVVAFDVRRVARLPIAEVSEKVILDYVGDPPATPSRHYGVRSGSRG